MRRTITSEEEALALLKDGKLALDKIPLEFRTAQVCMEAVGSTGFMLEYVPAELKTAELCFAAVKSMGYALEHVPAELKTYDMCLATVKAVGCIQRLPYNFFAHSGLNLTLKLAFINT